ncbi:MAG: ATP-binding cassette domain-containing protein [Bacilli bacterium]|nr:ATP-binding cassette domain-containing protein [Bacilli bacterium]
MIELKNISKYYKETIALKNINIKFPKKGFIAILGHSGCGKTTLLNIIGGLTKPSCGNIILANKNTKNFKEKEWDSYRNNMIGFVFQNYHLINHLSVMDNINLKLKLSNKFDYTKKSLKVLNEVGLLSKKKAYPYQLSGGEKQRVAIARALVNDPPIILADEPTGALDSKTSLEIMNLFLEISKEKLVIMVTHNEKLALKYTNHIIRMQDGKIINKPQLEKNNINTKINLKKTKLSFITAIKLSLKNLLSKKFRFFLTALAASIGLIGIVIILAISSGFNKQIKDFEKQAMANFPIVIQNGVVNQTINNNKLKNSSKDLIVSETIANKYHENKFTNSYLDFIANLNNNFISSVSYQYAIDYEIKINKKSLSSININMFSINKDYFSSEFNLLTGCYPKDDNEALLLVNENKEISRSLVDAFSLNKNKIDSQKIINQKILLKNKNKDTKLTIVGIGIIKDESVIGAMQFNYDKDNFVYLDSLDKTLNKNIMPQIIYLYPKDFKGKENIINYLSENKEIIFSDYAKDLTDTTKELINILTIILILFSCISLIVSILMISIVIYISVLERTKEIGILRSLGARSKDIRKIFLAEGFLIGLTSGIIAIVISYLLIDYINKLLYQYLEISNIAQINFNICVSVLVTSIILTLISSLIPAFIASKKEPVISLSKE